MLKTDSLRAQDVLVACKLYSLGLARSEWTYSKIAEELGLSAGESHNSVDRCRLGGLFLPSREISRANLRDLLVVAVPRIYYAQRGGTALGLITGTHAVPLRAKFCVAKGSTPHVWARPPREDDPDEEIDRRHVRRGESIFPIYPTAILAATRDDVVYELLALVDVLRVGTEPERARAVELLDERLLGRGGERAR